jgi:prepilin-type N-terminal cleavage/methylation domain-containing protein
MTTHPSRTHQQAGLSLVEIIVAIGVFSIIMLALSGTIIQGLQIRRNNSVESQALTFAASTLEQYKNLWADYENYKCFNVASPNGRSIASCDSTKSYTPNTPVPTSFQANAFTFECLNTAGVPYTDSECHGSDDNFIPELRRITVVLRDPPTPTDPLGKIRATLATEIGNPIPER